MQLKLHKAPPQSELSECCPFKVEHLYEFVCLTPRDDICGTFRLGLPHSLSPGVSRLLGACWTLRHPPDFLGERRVPKVGGMSSATGYLVMACELMRIESFRKEEDNFNLTLDTLGLGSCGRV